MRNICIFFIVSIWNLLNQKQIYRWSWWTLQIIFVLMKFTDPCNSTLLPRNPCKQRVKDGVKSTHLYRSVGWSDCKIMTFWRGSRPLRINIDSDWHWTFFNPPNRAKMGAILNKTLHMTELSLNPYILVWHFFTASSIGSNGNNSEGFAQHVWVTNGMVIAMPRHVLWKW